MTTAIQAGWTDERTALAVKLWQEGLSGSRIAERLGVTRNAVIGKLHRLGMPPRSKAAHKATYGYKAPRKPKLRIAGGGAVFEVAVAPPPIVIVPEAVFDALPGTVPRPWEERTLGQCSWPVGDGLNCCADVHAYGWCRSHAAIGRQPIPKRERNLGRNLRWYLG